MGILLCSIVLAFSYSLVVWVVRRMKNETLIHNVLYIWAFIVFLISLFYGNSLIRINSFDFLGNHSFYRELVIFAAAGILLAHLPGYFYGNRKYVLNFVFLYPITEEILFRGTIFPLLLEVDFISIKTAYLLSAVLFGVMHIQYFKFHSTLLSKIVVAIIMGYFFASLTHVYQSLIPAVVLHILYNVAAMYYAKRRDRIPSIN